ncbi:ribosome hibernation-promoting factor, HPF/YfiA family [Zavarzinia sp. CC-PAN008]|uniref:ribosome hibernation-promoting factor, HPF/YfiA family n=1 Tax=Zavarzinia sp. CC-PAN008 TaxID=3243332 RepID=UPI003F74A9C8
MQLQINGKHIDVGDAMRTHVRERLGNGVAKYFEKPIDGNVTISRQAHLFRTDCQVHFGAGMTAIAHGEAADVYASFDQAADRLEKQLRRYKRRLKRHHGERKAPAPSEPARSYVLAAEPEEEEHAEGDAPIIIAETTTEIASLSVRDAAMRMDLGDMPALLFKNSVHGGLSLVYRRPDGNIGWIEPGSAA